MLFAQQAIGGLVYRPHHVMFTPVVSVFAHFFLMLLTFLWWLFLPGFILLLFPLVESILLVLLLVLLVALFLSFIHNSAEFVVQLELALERINGGGNQTIFSSSGDLAPQSPLVFNQLNLHFANVMRAS